MRVNLREGTRALTGSGPAAAHARQLKRFEEPLLGRGGRSRSQRCIFALDQGRLWALGTIRQLPDEDAIPPSAGSGSRQPGAGPG